MALPTKIALEVVTPEGLLLRDDVDELVAPGAEGYFGVRPGHTPLLAALGLGELSYRQGQTWRRLTCFSGWCEVLPDRVNVLADIAERAEDIDVERAEQGLRRAEERMKRIMDEIRTVVGEMENHERQLLDTRNRLIRIAEVSVGSLNASIVHPREVFKEAIAASAAAVVFAHNHPSGVAEASEDDVKLTKRLAEAGEIVGIDVLDHIIIGDRGFFSLKREGRFR